MIEIMCSYVPETENLFQNRSDVIYDTNDKKNPPPEIPEFIQI